MGRMVEVAGGVEVGVERVRGYNFHNHFGHCNCRFCNNHHWSKTHQLVDHNTNCYHLELSHQLHNKYFHYCNHRHDHMHRSRDNQLKTMKHFCIPSQVMTEREVMEMMEVVA